MNKNGATSGGGKACLESSTQRSFNPHFIYMVGVLPGQCHSWGRASRLGCGCLPGRRGCSCSAPQTRTATRSKAPRGPAPGRGAAAGGGRAKTVSRSHTDTPVNTRCAGTRTAPEPVTRARTVSHTAPGPAAPRVRTIRHTHTHWTHVA